MFSCAFNVLSLRFLNANQIDISYCNLDLTNVHKFCVHFHDDLKVQMHLLLEGLFGTKTVLLSTKLLSLILHSGAQFLYTLTESGKM